MATDSTDLSAPNPGAQALVQRLRSQRDEVLTELAQLTDAECRLPAAWGGTQRTVNFLLRAYSTHEMDHLQHAERLLRARGRTFSEAQLLLKRMQALRGEMEALLLSLSDEELDATGPEADDWSIRRLAEHLLSVDAGYLRDVRAGLAEANGAPA
jgi:hypothetical protein